MDFLVKVLCGGVKARIRVNGVQVFRVQPGATKSAKVDVNPYIVEGANTVDLHLGPVGSVPADANLDVKVLGSESGKPLASFRWDPAKTKLDPQAPVKVWSAEFPVGKAFGRWSWETAPQTEPDAADQEAIVRIVAELHQALARKDADAVAKLMAVKIEELGRAYGIKPDRMRKDQREFLESLFAHKDWGMHPVKAEGLTLVPAAQGRLYAVTDPSGGAPVRGTADKQEILFPLMLSRVEGGWKIVR